MPCLLFARILTYIPGHLLGAGHLFAVAISELSFDLVIFPATTPHEVRHLLHPALLPYPSMSPEGSLNFGFFIEMVFTPWVQFYFPLLVFGAVIPCLIAHACIWTAVREVGQFHWAMLLLLIYGGSLFIQGLSRTDWIHLLPTSIVAMMLFSGLLWEVRSRGGEAQHWMASTVLVVVLAGPFLLEPARRHLRSMGSGLAFNCSSMIDRARCFKLGVDQECAINYIVEHTSIGDGIFVGNSRQDRFFVNDIMFYFLAERQCATKYHELYPGPATTPPVQRAIVEDLKKFDVHCIVLSSRFDSRTEPNQSALSSGIMYPDTFIRNNHQLVEPFGEYLIWKLLQGT